MNPPYPNKTNYWSHQLLSSYACASSFQPDPEMSEVLKMDGQKKHKTQRREDFTPFPISLEFFDFVLIFQNQYFGKLDFLKKIKSCDDLILLNDQNDVIKAKKVKLG